EGQVTIEIEGAPVPVGIVEHPEFPEFVAPRFSRPDKIGGPGGFRTQRPASEDPLAGPRIPCAVIYFPDRLHLRRCETVVLISALAQKRAWIEIAAARVVDNAVRHAVNGIAGRDRGLGDQR